MEKNIVDITGTELRRIVESKVRDCVIDDIRDRELYNFAGLRRERLGLPVDMYFDQDNSYIQFKHPIWVYIPSEYNKDSRLIPITVDDLKVMCDLGKVKIHTGDLAKVLAFIARYRDEIYKISNDTLDIRDFGKMVGSVNENFNRELITEMSKVHPEETGLPFDIWIGNNKKNHFLGVKFQPNNSETNSGNYPEVSVPDCKVYKSTKIDYEAWRLKWVIAFIEANKSLLISLGRDPLSFDDLIPKLTKLDANMNPIANEPEWIIVDNEKFGFTKVKNREGKYNFLNRIGELVSDTWFDKLDDVKKKNGKLIVYGEKGDEIGFLHLNPTQWNPVRY